MLGKKPNPTPDLVNTDYAQIERRLMGDMAKHFGVPREYGGGEKGRHALRALRPEGASSLLDQPKPKD